MSVVGGGGEEIKRAERGGMVKYRAMAHFRGLNQTPGYSIHPHLLLPTPHPISAGP